MVRLLGNDWSINIGGGRWKTHHKIFLVMLLNHTHEMWAEYLKLNGVTVDLSNAKCMLMEANQTSQSMQKFCNSALALLLMTDQK